MRNTRSRSKEYGHLVPADRLKVCPLCSCLNSDDTPECHVCGWHGTFLTDRENVFHSIVDLLSRCPDLLDALRPKKFSLRGCLERMRRRKRLDIEV